jgi:uncharacterized protein (TIGR02145 family)
VNCTKCKAEWTPPAGRTITNCPFCGEAIFAATFAGKDGALHEMLHSIVQQYGQEILGEARLRGLLADLMPNAERRHLRLVRQVVDDGVGAKLLEMKGDHLAVKTMKISALKETFRTTNAFNHTADYVVDCLVYALGWMDQPPKEGVNTVQVNNRSILQHTVNMAFSDGQLTKEETKSLFSLAETLSIPVDEVTGLINEKLRFHNLQPDKPVDKTLKNKREIIISRDWLPKDDDSSDDEYESVQIGDQVWMKRNLDVSHFRNGEPIPEAKTNEEWVKAGVEGKPAWCYYDNEPENGKIYGKLYNWYAVNDRRGLAPEGWHVPSDEEWKILEKLVDRPYREIPDTFRSLFILNFSYANMRGYDVGKKLKSKSSWAENGNGYNQFNFNALPGGDRSHRDSFRGLGESSDWWTSSQDTDVHAWFRLLKFDANNIGRYRYFKSDGRYVRCIKDY